MAKVVMTVSTEDDKVVGIGFSSIHSIKWTLKRVMEQLDADDRKMLGIRLDFSTNEKLVESLNGCYRLLYDEMADEFEYFENTKTEALLVDTKSMEDVKNFLEAL